MGTRAQDPDKVFNQVRHDNVETIEASGRTLAATLAIRPVVIHRTKGGQR